MMTSEACPEIDSSWSHESAEYRTAGNVGWALGATNCDAVVDPGTIYGDANLDGQFDSSDLVQVFTAGEYDDGIPGNSTWSEGDWDGNGDFDSSDLSLAFSSGSYGTDDRFENNDRLADAADLGTIEGPRTYDDLRMLDDLDWYRFRTDRAGDETARVSLRFRHARGDLDFDVFNSTGQLIGASTGSGDLEQVSLTGMSAGEYFIRVYGYRGARNPSYSLEIDPGNAPQFGTGPSLWLNFDGAYLAPSDLERWSADWHYSWTHLDPERDGVRVRSFLWGTPGWSQREAIVNQIISNVQHDLDPYGITVRRWHGTAVENVGDTTIFVGRNPLDHVAGDIDLGNDNLTDIAFVTDEWWGDAASTSLALSDVVLHEAGHTYGLFHVDTNVGGYALAESMGLRYSELDYGRWVQDTSFLDLTFVEYLNHGFGLGSQNSHQTMRRNFGLATRTSSAGLVRYSLSDLAVFSIVASAEADVFRVYQRDAGHIELEVNGERFRISGATQLRVYTAGDRRDQIEIPDDLQIEVLVDHGSAGDLSDLGKIESNDAFQRAMHWPAADSWPC